MKFLCNTFLLFFATLSCSVTANDNGLSEKQIKAAYLYKFANYVEWPVTAFEQPDMPIIIGILGADELSEELSYLIGQANGERKVTMKRLKPDEPINGVHILFVGQRYSHQLTALLEHGQKRPVLIVTDSSGALEAGSVINFVFVEEHIRFEISLDHAEQKGLKISARLLSVAHKIEARR